MQNDYNITASMFIFFQLPTTMLKDERFGKIFTDPDFEIDSKADQFKNVNFVIKTLNKATSRTEDGADDNDSDESENGEMVDDTGTDSNEEESEVSFIISIP